MTEQESLQLQIFEGSMARIEAMVQQALAESLRPVILFKPTLSLDGDRWCMLLGEDLATGVAAFGCTPHEAASNFDYVWQETQAQKKEREEATAGGKCPKPNSACPECEERNVRAGCRATPKAAAEGGYKMGYAGESASSGAVRDPQTPDDSDEEFSACGEANCDECHDEDCNGRR